MTKKNFLLVLLICSIQVFGQKEKLISVDSKNISIELDSTGKIISINYKDGIGKRNIIAYTQLQSFVTNSSTVSKLIANKSVQFVHQLYSDSLHQSCTLTEIFKADGTGIDWKIAIKGAGENFSVPIKTIIEYPATRATNFWTAWGAPPIDSSAYSSSLMLQLQPGEAGNKNQSWIDPLIPVPITDQQYFYGAPPFDYKDVKQGFIPLQHNLFAIPLAMLQEQNDKKSLTVILSPDDPLINLQLRTSLNGIISFERMFNRIGKQAAVEFNARLVAHDKGWRSALAVFAKLYPGYVYPKNNLANKMGGTAAYSNFFDDFDADKMKRMAFTVNWQASFDFPYMGMFLPPVKSNQQWERFGGGTISADAMDAYAKRMKQKGFYVLSYFNVTEFGAEIKYPFKPTMSSTDPAFWKDANNYLYTKFPAAFIKVDKRVNITNDLDNRTVYGGPYFSWKSSVAMDCGEKNYRAFLLEQAKQHIRKIPNSYGICIDRLDWLRFFNQETDDSISWFDNRSTRSLVSSWKSLIQELGPMMHQAGKVIFVNNHYKRIDLLQHADGILDEFTNATTPLNTTAFLTLHKPALGWTPNKEIIFKEGGDYFMQKYLYLGVFPMCPFPGNDHALQPDPVIDQLYLDYGLMMNQLNEKQWVLQPGVIEAEAAKANIFKTKNGYAIPVVYGRGDYAVIKLRHSHFLQKGIVFKVIHPGTEKPVSIIPTINKDLLTFNIPLVRGAAMLVSN